MPKRAENSMNSSLQLKPAIRSGESLGSGSKMERRFFDFIVDGVSLLSKCLEKGFDEVGCLGWGGQAIHSEAQARLLDESPGDFDDGRVALFVCPECGDLGCGAVSIRLRREGQSVVWDEIGWQTNYEEGWNAIDDLGPYSFDFKQYRAAIESTVLLENPPA